MDNKFKPLSYFFDDIDTIVFTGADVDINTYDGNILSPKTLCKNIIDIDAVIFCEKASHKGIVIGKHGDMLKKIASSARCDMENFFAAKINLQCWVKVKEDWRNREGLIKNFGYK